MRERAVIDIPGHEAPLAKVRQHITEIAERCFGARDPRVDNTVLIINELVTNALEHTASGVTGGHVHIEVVVDDEALHGEVIDDGGSSTSPEAQALTSDIETGRGLVLVSALASRWGSDPDSNGTAVWFEIDLASVEAQTPPRSAPPQGGEAVAGSGTSPAAAGHGLNN